MPQKLSLGQFTDRRDIEYEPPKPKSVSSVTTAGMMNSYLKTAKNISKLRDSQEKDASQSSTRYEVLQDTLNNSETKEKH